MSRQILTLPDLPSSVINQTTGDARYVRLSGGTGAVMTGALQWGATSAAPDASLQRTGVGAVRLDDRLGVGIAPSAWGSVKSLQVGAFIVWADTTQTSRVGSNTYYDGAVNRAVATGTSSYFAFDGNVMTFRQAPSVAAGVTQVFVDRIGIPATGMVTLNPDAGYPAIVSGRAGDAWLTDYRTVQLGSGGSLYAHSGYPQIGLNANLYYPVGGGTRYCVNGLGASLLLGQDGVLYFDNAPNGTGGATATVTRKMQVNADGAMEMSGPGASYMFKSRDTQANGFMWYAQGGNAYLYDRVTLVNRITIAANGTIQLSADAGQQSLQWGGGAGSLHSSGGIPYILGQTGGYTMLGLGISGGNCISVAPGTHNSTHLGWGDRGWALVHSVSGLVQDSLASEKENFASLDPAACAESVLATDWLSFSYIAPPPPVRGKDVDNDEWTKQQARYEQAEVLAAPARKQKGYALGSPDFKVGALFGSEDRAHAQTQSDLAVIACALQNALRRIAELEAKAAPAA